MLSFSLIELNAKEGIWEDNIKAKIMPESIVFFIFIPFIFYVNSFIASGI